MFPNFQKMLPAVVLKKAFSVVTLITFITTTLVSPAYGQAAFNLPAPGQMVGLSGSFSPVVLKGVSIHPDDPLLFDFIIDNGSSELKGADLVAETTRLVKYFLAGLAVPEKELWVNLSPKEKDRIMAEGLSHTDAGRELLAQDYILKQVTSTLMYPEKDLGRRFWDEVYKRAHEQFGPIDIPVDAFNKVWITPDQATVYQHGQSAFIAESHLKVMLESDYLAGVGAASGRLDKGHPEGALTQELTKTLVRQIILPVLEKEVNEGKNFAALRQVFHSMILAGWYKNALKQSLLSRIYSNSNKFDGITIPEKNAREKVYAQYLEAYQKGVYNYIKDEFDRNTNETIPRKYFSGGITDLAMTPKVVTDRAALGKILTGADLSASRYRMQVLRTDAAQGEDSANLDSAQAVSAVIKRASALLLRIHSARSVTALFDWGLLGYVVSSAPSFDVDWRVVSVLVVGSALGGIVNFWNTQTFKREMEQVRAGLEAQIEQVRDGIYKRAIRFPAIFGVGMSLGAHWIPVSPEMKVQGVIGISIAMLAAATTWNQYVVDRQLSALEKRFALDGMSVADQGLSTDEGARKDSDRAQVSPALMRRLSVLMERIQWSETLIAAAVGAMGAWLASPVDFNGNWTVAGVMLGATSLAVIVERWNLNVLNKEMARLDFGSRMTVGTVLQRSKVRSFYLPMAFGSLLGAAYVQAPIPNEYKLAGALFLTATMGAKVTTWNQAAIDRELKQIDSNVGNDSAQDAGERYAMPAAREYTVDFRGFAYAAYVMVARLMTLGRKEYQAYDVVKSLRDRLDAQVEPMEQAVGYIEEGFTVNEAVALVQGGRVVQGHDPAMMNALSGSIVIKRLAADAIILGVAARKSFPDNLAQAIDIASALVSGGVHRDDVEASLNEYKDKYRDHQTSVAFEMMKAESVFVQGGMSQEQADFVAKALLQKATGWHAGPFSMDMIVPVAELMVAQKISLDVAVEEIMRTKMVLNSIGSSSLNIIERMNIHAVLRAYARLRNDGRDHEGALALAIDLRNEFVMSQGRLNEEGMLAAAELMSSGIIQDAFNAVLAVKALTRQFAADVPQEAEGKALAVTRFAGKQYFNSGMTKEFSLGGLVLGGLGVPLTYAMLMPADTAGYKVMAFYVAVGLAGAVGLYKSIANKAMIRGEFLKLGLSSLQDAAMAIEKVADQVNRLEKGVFSLGDELKPLAISFTKILIDAGKSEEESLGLVRGFLQYYRNHYADMHAEMRKDAMKLMINIMADGLDYEKSFKQVEKLVNGYQAFPKVYDGYISGGMLSVQRLVNEGLELGKAIGFVYTIENNLSRHQDRRKILSHQQIIISTETALVVSDVVRQQRRNRGGFWTAVGVIAASSVIVSGVSNLLLPLDPGVLKPVSSIGLWTLSGGVLGAVASAWQSVGLLKKIYAYIDAAQLDGAQANSFKSEKYVGIDHDRRKDIWDVFGSVAGGFVLFGAIELTALRQYGVDDWKVGAAWSLIAAGGIAGAVYAWKRYALAREAKTVPVTPLSTGKAVLTDEYIGAMVIKDLAVRTASAGQEGVLLLQGVDGVEWLLRVIKTYDQNTGDVLQTEFILNERQNEQNRWQRSYAGDLEVNTLNIKEVLQRVNRDVQAPIIDNAALTKGGIDLGQGDYLKVVATDAAGVPEFDPRQLQKLQEDLRGVVPVPVGGPQGLDVKALLGL